MTERGRERERERETDRERERGREREREREGERERVFTVDEKIILNVQRLWGRSGELKCLNTEEVPLSDHGKS
jgi:hypothetical protein